MADIKIGLDIGRGVSPTFLGRMLCDVGAVADAALVVGTMEARSAAQAAILDLAVSEPGALLERLRSGEGDSRELRLWLDQVKAWRRIAEDWQEWWSYAAKRPGPLPPPGPIPWFSTPGELIRIPPVMHRMIATDALRRRGDEAVLTKVRYKNPIEIVLTATGGVLVAAGWLLTIVRDWRPQKRIGEAAAIDAENTVHAREKFRQELLRKQADGQIQASPEEIMAALGDPPIEGMVRLAAMRPNIEIAGPDERQPE